MFSARTPIPAGKIRTYMHQGNLIIHMQESTFEVQGTPSELRELSINIMATVSKIPGGSDEQTEALQDSTRTPRVP